MGGDPKEKHTRTLLCLLSWRKIKLMFLLRKSHGFPCLLVPVSFTMHQMLLHAITYLLHDITYLLHARFKHSIPSQKRNSTLYFKKCQAPANSSTREVDTGGPRSSRSSLATQPIRGSLSSTRPHPKNNNHEAKTTSFSFKSSCFKETESLELGFQ